MYHFKVRNWEEFQNYSKRNPPWIRLYYRLLRDRKFFRQSNETKFAIVGIFLIASQNQNNVAADPEWLINEMGFDGIPDWQAIIESEFIIPTDCDASMLLAWLTKTDSQRQRQNTETEAEILSFSEIEKEHKGTAPSVRQISKEAHEIYQHWNTQSATMHHRAINGQEKAIVKALRHYAPAEIKRAIERYSQVRANTAGKYRELYAWTLGEFLTRQEGYNLERFNAEDWEAPFLAAGKGANHKPDTIGAGPEPVAPPDPERVRQIEEAAGKSKAKWQALMGGKTA